MAPTLPAKTCKAPPSAPPPEPKGEPTPAAQAPALAVKKRKAPSTPSPVRIRGKTPPPPPEVKATMEPPSTKVKRAPTRPAKKRKAPSPALPLSPKRQKKPPEAKPKLPEAGKDAADAKTAGEGAQASKAKTLGEMRELYPYLADEATVLIDPAVLERVLPSIDDNEAQALNSKIKKMRKKLAMAITESARMKSMEMPTLCLCPSTKLQPEKFRKGNENNLLFEHFNKMDDDNCTQERLARVEHEIVELRQIIIASQSPANIESNQRHDISTEKGMLYVSAESGLQSIVAENQIPRNILQKKIEAPKSLLRGNNKEVTSKFCYAIPRNVPQNILTLPNMILPPLNAIDGRTRKIDAESQTPRIEDMREVVLLSVVRPHGPVAKAVLQTSSQFAMVGNMRLGTQYCKVFVNDVLQREAPLSRPYGNMKKMFHALQCSIAWPRELIRHTTATGMAAPDHSSHQGH